MKWRAGWGFFRLWDEMTCCEPRLCLLHTSSETRSPPFAAQARYHLLTVWGRDGFSCILTHFHASQVKCSQGVRRMRSNCWTRMQIKHKYVILISCLAYWPQKLYFKIWTQNFTRTTRGIYWLKSKTQSSTHKWWQNSCIWQQGTIIPPYSTHLDISFNQLGSPMIADVGSPRQEAHSVFYPLSSTPRRM